MNIKITCVTDEIVGAKINEVMVQLEDALAQLFFDKHFGLDQFIAMIVAVFADEIENEAFSKAYDKVGSYKHLVTGERVKYLSMAVVLDPIKVRQMSSKELTQAIVNGLLARLSHPPAKLPKGVAYERFRDEMQSSLDLCKQALA